MSITPIPEGLRIAVYNAMGGWGPYTVREIDELFRLYGFTAIKDIEDVGGVRRTTAESYQLCIDWADLDQRERYLMLVDDVLENFPDVDGKPDDTAKIERALRSCEVMVAYVTPGFAESDWTDQEVGWALGRDLVVVPVSVEGAMPRGFLGTYQAVRRHEGQTDVALAREVTKAIVDAVFEAQRPAALTVRSRIAQLLADAFCRVRSFDSARFWYQLLARIPVDAWTREMRTSVNTALGENLQLKEAVLSDKAGTPIPVAVRALIDARDGRLRRQGYKAE